jgi:hypothetical protein
LACAYSVDDRRAASRLKKPLLARHVVAPAKASWAKALWHAIMAIVVVAVPSIGVVGLGVAPDPNRFVDKATRAGGHSSGSS